MNGFQLREAIRQWELTRDGAANFFEDSLRKFPDETKPTPDSVMADYTTAEAAIAALQAVQATYNLRVVVTALNLTMTLLEAVKRLGGAGRAAKLWRTAAGDDKKRRGYNTYGDDVRKADETRAVPTVSRETALERAKVADRFASALRAAIAKGNVQDMDLELDPLLLR